VQIAKGGEDDLLISLQLGGETLLTQDGREAHLRPGQFALYDSERPYKLQMTAGTHLVCLQFPRAQIAGRVGNASTFVAQAVRGDVGIGGLFAGLARALPARLAEIDASAATRVADHVLDLLALSVTDTLRGVRALTSSKAMLLARLKRIIGEHLRDPDLDPGRVASLAGISKRHANRLLAAEGTSIERFIVAARLARCHAALGTPACDGQTIGEIAFAWGFSDLSHFSRAFRACYGCSPRDFRNVRRASG
jgi:AraC-like DNA-binding protein